MRYCWQVIVRFLCILITRIPFCNYSRIFWMFMLFSKFLIGGIFMKHFNIVNNTNTFVKNTRLPLNAIYGEFRLNNGRTITYYVDELSTTLGEVFFHYFDEKTNKWIETNTGSNHAYIGFKKYLCEKLTKFNLWGITCIPYIERSFLPQRKCAQNNKSMLYKTRYIGYALNTHIMTDDCVSNIKRKCVTYTGFAK